LGRPTSLRVLPGPPSNAGKLFRDGLAIACRLAKADPGNAGWQARPVGVPRQDRRRAGGAGQSAGGAEIVPRRLAIADRLAKADPDTPAGSVGAVQVAQGNLRRR
jgi:hypothetical protein